MQQILDTNYYIKISESPRTGHVRTQLYIRDEYENKYIRITLREADPEIKIQLGIMRYDYALTKFKAHLYD